MKKGFLFLLFAVLLMQCLPLCAVCIADEPVTVTVTAVNAVRGEGFLVVYTPDFGPSSLTNEYGLEAVIEADHRVSSIGGNNNEIPEGGFVLSAHDADNGSVLMKTWLIRNVHVGDYVYFNSYTNLLTASKTPLPLAELTFFEKAFTADGINEQRKADSLILYTPSYGATTNTNEYGYEVVIEDGLVVERGGNNSVIPKNGFVLSGHGTQAKWLEQSVRYGMSVTYSGKTCMLIFDADSLLNGTYTQLERLPEVAEQARDSFVFMDYDAFDDAYAALVERLDEAADLYREEEDAAQLVLSCETVQNDLLKLKRTVCESSPVEYRAVWLRPTQRNAAEVEQFVSQMHGAGINTLCVEGNFDNSVIMEVPKGSLFEKNIKFRYDVLQAFVDACHKYGMECHLWFHVYHVGDMGQKNYYRSVGYKKPEWLCQDQTGNADNEYRFAMIDPANREAREYLVSFYTYLLEEYDIDGFQLDYIRYYDRTETLDFGYTEEAIGRFQEQYATDVTPTYDPEADYWEDWVQFRKDQITALVRDVKTVIETYKPGVLLTADVVPSIYGAGANNYQDYVCWETQGLIDLLHPMAYVDGYGKDILDQVAFGSDRCMVVPGLGVFKADLTADDMARQLVEQQAYGTHGCVFFESESYLNDHTPDVLLPGAYRNAACAPFFDPDASLEAMLSYSERRINENLLCYGGVTEEEATRLLQAIANAKTHIKDGRIDQAEYQALTEAVGEVENPLAKQRLKTDLKTIERIGCVLYNVPLHELSAATLPTGQPFPPRPEEPENPSEAPGETSEASDASEVLLPAPANAPNEKSSFPLWWLVIVLVVLGCGGCAFFIVKGKKRNAV